MDPSADPIDPWTVPWAESSPELGIEQGTVLKHSVACGAGNRHGGVPIDGCVCDVDVTGWVQDSRQIFLTTYERIDGRLVGGTGEPLQVHLGFGTIAHSSLATRPFRDYMAYADSAGLPDCIASVLGGMQVGERCLVWMDAQAAYGATGDGGKVPPGADIVLWLHLRGFSLPAPPALPAEAQQAAKAAQHEKDKDDFMANPPPSWSSRLQSSAAEKAAGNALFLRQQWADAAKAYGRGMVHLFLSAQEAQFAPVAPPDLLRIHEAKAALLLNRSAAHKALLRWDSAEWDANEGMKHALQAAGAMRSTPTVLNPLDIPASCLKGLFRRAQCRLQRAQEAFQRRPCLHLGACEEGARKAAADFEASQKARSIVTALVLEEQGTLHVVPPAAGHDRVQVGDRVSSPPAVSRAASSGIQQAHQLIKACQARRREDAAAAMKTYGGSLLGKPAAAAASASDDESCSDEVPELGD